MAKINNLAIPGGPSPCPPLLDPPMYSGLSRIVRKRDFGYAKTKAQISFAVTVKLISAFDFATMIVQLFFFRDPKFQASSHLIYLYRPVCVRPGRKRRRPVFSHHGSISFVNEINLSKKAYNFV